MHLRKHLRGWTTIWLAFQLVSLSAFVPRDCCAAHRTHKAPPQAASADVSCAMQHGEHHGAAVPAPEPPMSGDCSLRGRCDGPMAVLLSVLSTHGVLAGSPAVSPSFDRGSLALVARESLISRFVPPDSPPPRS
jgi:hypothetical protein